MVDISSEKKWTAAILLAILALAAALRLINLGYCAFRGDEFVFSTAETDLVELWRNPPWHNQIPLGESICIIANKIIPGEATHFTIRLPFAVMGILAVWAIYLFASMALGSRLALMAAFLAAINPAHIYLSREAYHYSGVILFSALTFCAFWRCWTRFRSGRLPLKREWLVWLLTGVIMAHTHMQTWFVFGVQWLVLAIGGYLALKSDRSRLPKLMLSLAVVALLYGLAVIRWLIRAMAEGDVNELKRGALLGDWVGYFDTIKDAIPVYVFGAWVPGLLLLLLFVLAGVWYYRNTVSVRSAVNGMGIVFLSSLLVLLIVIAVVGKGRVKTSYFAVLFPLLISFLAVALRGSVEWIRERTRLTFKSATMIVLAFLCVYYIRPVMALIELPGKPRPYKQVEEWIEREMPDRDIILARSLPVKIQMRYYTPANSHITFLLPIMPQPDLKTKYENKHKEKALLERFGRNFPDALLFGYDRLVDEQLQGVVEWDIDRFYKSRKVFVNEPGMVLRRWKVVPQPAFDLWNRKGLVCVLSYNTEQDMLELARAAGRAGVCLFGDGWQFVKTKNFSNWRMLAGPADLEVLNAGDREVEVYLLVRGVAAGGEKTVQFGDGHKVQFPANKPATRKVGPYRIPKDGTEIDVTDEGGNGSLLLQNILVKRERKGL